MIRRDAPAAAALLATFGFLPSCFAQDLTYRLDPELGVPYRATTTSTNRTDLQMEAAGMDVESTIAIEIDQDVVFEAGDDDTVQGNYTISAVSADVDGMPGIDQAPFDPNDVYQAMVGITIELVMARSGRIVEFGGVEEVMEAVLDRTAAPPHLRGLLREFFETNFGEQQMTQMGGLGGLAMPEHPLAVGDAWTDSVSALGLEVDTTYTLASRGDGRATVEADASIGAGDEAGFEFPGMPSMPGMEMRFENLSGGLTGKYELDEATGLAVAWTTQMALDMEIVMEMPQPPGQSADASSFPRSLRMSMSSEVTVTGEIHRAE